MLKTSIIILVLFVFAFGGFVSTENCEIQKGKRLETSTISAIIADEAAIGMVNSKTTAVRIIPAPGKVVGDRVEMGGLLGSAPVMPVHGESAADFVARGGRIPAPIHSLKN